MKTRKDFMSMKPLDIFFYNGSCKMVDELLSKDLKKYKAEENLCHNLDLLSEALLEFGENGIDALKKGAKFCDVTIRCYLLGSAINEALDELEEEIE